MPTSYGSFTVEVIVDNLCSLMFCVISSEKKIMRNNLYDALSDYGIGHRAAKTIVRTFLTKPLPKFRVNLVATDFKGYDSVQTSDDE